jgi:hypothetical protein
VKQRKPGTQRYEEGGRFLYSYGPTGTTVYDMTKWLTGWKPTPPLYDLGAWNMQSELLSDESCRTNAGA